MNNLPQLIASLEARLDEKPWDFVARAVLADLYEEMNLEQEAAIQRLLIRYRVCPFNAIFRRELEWHWYSDDEVTQAYVDESQKAWASPLCVFAFAGNLCAYTTLYVCVTRKKAESELFKFASMPTYSGILDKIHLTDEAGEVKDGILKEYGGLDD